MKAPKALNILFMGTPGFAVPSLEILLENNYNVVGVVTVADKPAGRGYQLQESDVKKAAVKHGLKILQPMDLKAPEFLQELGDLKVNLIVIVAFRKLPKEVWAMPAYGTFNLHGSLLPNYRGAAPLNWALINGEKETGVTTFFLDEKIDTGELIDSRSIAISENDTVGDVHDQLMMIGAALVLKTVQAIENETYSLTNQNDVLKGKEAKKAPKIFKKDCELIWTKPANEIHDLVRGLSPYPAAYSTLLAPDGSKKKIKIFRTEKVSQKGNAGEVVTDGIGSLIICCGNNEGVKVLELQPEGKKRMKTADYLRGNKLTGCQFI